MNKKKTVKTKKIKNINNEKKKSKIKSVNIVKIINKTLIFSMIFFTVGILGFFTYIYINAPEFNSNLLYKQE